jgi:hypothetical protein
MVFPESYRIDVDQADGRPFIAMELLEVQTLRQRIAGKALKLEETLELAIQIADGLEAAHNRGSVHGRRCIPSQRQWPRFFGKGWCDS